MTSAGPLDPKEKFIARDLSWLMFNERVLEEASDNTNPLLERLRFLAIFTSNLDEFYMVRLAGLKRLIDSKYSHKDKFGYFPEELFVEVRKQADVLTKKFYEVFQGKMRKDLEKNKVFFKNHEELTPEQERETRKYFESTLFPIITPMAVDQGHPFPILPSKTIAFAVNVLRDNKPHLAIIPVPKNVSRFVRLPSERGEACFIMVEEIIRAYLKNFFRGYQLQEQTLFRVMRDSELYVAEEFAEDLLVAIEQEVKQRMRAKVVHLEIEKSCAPEFLDILCQGLGFPKEEVVSIGGTLDLSCLFELARLLDNPALSYREYKPAKIEYENIFERISQGDFISHLPFQSFYPTVDLIQTAAHDPNVLAIKMTLYRANEDSAIISALVEAAQNKKQVTILVEIKARFDEEKNIRWAKVLEDAGCHVIYGIANIKIHSKMTLIVRKEEDRIRRYVHLSTGNYNEKTARVYTDIGYFTANDDVARDISDVFNVITGYSLPSMWKRVVSSPNDMRKYFFELIDREIENQKRSKSGLISAKMNSLEDVQMIDKLYEASKAGVKIKLVVRGICCLIPGVPGLSENIEVKSIVGRFLEHTRVMIFNNNGNPRVFLSSADWMSRNFDSRIELLFEIYQEEIKEHLQYLMDMCWKDNSKSRLLQPDRKYTRQKDNEEKFNFQERMISYYGR
ncbi:MAG: polyphosphate kinase 1 [Candidatus Omnitrophica bacterium]|nr:polyphosphate kinase 1 [Candidatus Omnitrophota bacterium]